MVAIETENDLLSLSVLNLAEANTGVLTRGGQKIDTEA